MSFILYIWVFFYMPPQPWIRSCSENAAFPVCLQWQCVVQHYCRFIMFIFGLLIKDLSWHQLKVRSPSAVTLHIGTHGMPPANQSAWSELTVVQNVCEATKNKSHNLISDISKCMKINSFNLNPDLPHPLHENVIKAAKSLINYVIQNLIN